MNSIFEPNDHIVAQMKTIWRKEFPGTTPSVVGRAPGRLTLIGDHIDYSGFASLMMATQGRFTTAMIAESDTHFIRMRNLDPQFPPSNLPIDPIMAEEAIDNNSDDDDNNNSNSQEGNPDDNFRNKIKECNQSSRSHHQNGQKKIKMNGEGWSLFVEGAVRAFASKTHKKFNGIDLLITNSVPISSGLSSSGAILCAIVAALNELAETNLSKQDLIQIAIDAEHTAGFMTGGMDQNATFLAKKGFACLVSFNPPSVRPIKLPPAKFVVAHCGVSNSKIDNPLNAYNQRLKEVTRCAELMKSGCKTIREVVLAVGIDEALNLANLLPEHEGDLVLRDRAIHVLEESTRVKAFCTSELAKWGKLMDDSHESLRDLYNCSCPEMDSLIDAGMRCGAMGARITGSGWGGCAQFLLNSTQDPEPFIHQLLHEYFETRRIKNPIVFSTYPGPGADSMKI
ncbi:galactokinase family protein [Tritrichomonas foetus]|uniref:Galactokinase family protein n=1 Tax=Tritrichomonas foetus TaxID=1144522 RepID=A0A1J4K1K4_9EUKA|nr:galactokinase family protein [Tritrichomonas foetus]|eukprot:OHT03357.1 galactokinase family protein [Tritrichomonas foetus]